MSYREMLEKYMNAIRKDEDRRNTMNVWETVIDYMNQNVGQIGSRQALLHHVKNNRVVWRQGVGERYQVQQFSTVDCYKNYLIQAGLIHKVKVNGKNLQGKFFIPEKLKQYTLKEVRDMAYGPKLMMIGTDRASKSMCMSAGHYYIGGTNKSDYSIYADTNTKSVPKEPEFLSKKEMKI